MKYKSFSHWYEYHKAWIIGGIIVGLMVLTLYWTHSGESDPDYRVSWVGKTLLSAEEEEALMQAVRVCGEDRNGDGEISVMVVQYAVNFTPDSSALTEENYGSVLKLIGQMESNECYLYFMEDPEGFQFNVGALRYLNGEPSGENDHYEYQRWEEMCVPWTCPGLEGRTIWLGRRALFHENPDYDAVFPGGEALFMALTDMGETG